MYLGRIVAIGMTANGNSTAMYRVSSRSFPNREARKNGDIISIMPRAGHEGDLSKNPYIAYNCIRLVDTIAIATNGSHTDPITEKIASGMAVRDAMCLGLLAMDYEKDSYNTPRIAAVTDKENKTGYLGIVRKDALLVKEFALEPGIAHYISTYEHDSPDDSYVDRNFDSADADSACRYIVNGGVFADFEHPVTSAAAFEVNGNFELATSVV